MNKLSYVFLILISLASCSPKWQPLFDGNSLDGWISVDGGTIPANIWNVTKDGTIVSHPDSTDALLLTNFSSEKGAMDIITKDEYTNFKLKVSFRMIEGSNGGIKYFINPGTFSSPSIGFEYQVIDDENYSVSHPAINNVQTTASLYDLLSSNKMNANFHPYEWNDAMIVVDGGKVEHWLNGVKVLEIDRLSTSFDLLVKNSKFRKEQGFGKLEGGHILLQDHGNKVYYRNIMIQRF